MNDASLEIEDHKGQTPLHQASKRGNIEVAKSLLEYGAILEDPAIVISALSPKMVSLLMYHFIRGYLGVLKVILKKGGK